MKNLQNDLNLDDGERLKDARVLYRHLSRVLAEAIDAIEASGHIDAKDAEHQAMVRKHHNALFQIITLEADLVKRSGRTAVTVAGTELDLAAAREEICSRLAKLVAKRGGEGLSGQSEP